LSIDGWRPAAFNRGWTYTDLVHTNDAGQSLVTLMAQRHSHSPLVVWQGRLAAGELSLNGAVQCDDITVEGGDQIVWRRPPWLEPSIPDQWETLHDDGDLLVINKPSGLPVMPGGGFLLHTLTNVLERRSQALGEPLAPKPVHRLGRFTSGVQVCARQPATRAALSHQFRPQGCCRKIYQAWAHRVQGLAPGQTLVVDSDVVERPHPLLGWVWGPEPADGGPVRRRLSARSELRLLERREEADRLEVLITTGRPHQIRIHLAQIASPLVGDPLYLTGRAIAATATPGDGGYRLHAWRLEAACGLGDVVLEAAPPWVEPASVVSPCETRSSERSRREPC